MKYGKKLASLLLATAIAVPMTLVSIKAETDNGVNAIVQFTKTDENGKALAGATIEFYKDSNFLFKATTREDGKLNPSDATDYINEKGELKLSNGDYSYIETKSPSNYMLNTDNNTLYVIGGMSKDITLENQKIPEGKGQIIIRAIDKNHKGLEGADIDIYSRSGASEKDRIATLTTDSNGNVIAAPSSGNVNAGLEAVGKSLAINEGTYYVKEKKAPQGFYLSDKEIPIKVSKASQSTVTIDHTLNDGRTQSIQTGVKIKGIDIKDNKPKSGLEVAIYKTENGKIVGKEIFIGKTGNDGYILNSSLGSSLLSNGVVELKAGDYIAKLHNLKNAKDHPFKVVNGKVTLLDMKTKTVSTVSGSNVKKSKDNKSTLAKTGSKDTNLLTFVGIGIAALGVFLVRKK